MGWDSLDGQAAPPETAATAAREAERRAVAAVMAVALEDALFRRYLTRLALGGSYSPGRPEHTAYREGIRALAVQLLHAGEGEQ